jgi:hypothetical protein
MRPYLEKNSSQRAGGVVQVVEHLPSKCEALSLNPSAEMDFFEIGYCELFDQAGFEL